MIYATINGQKAYPDSGMSIKLVLENPFMKEQGNHTYQVSFPLSIPENIKAFGSVNRIEVRKRTNTYGDCALFAGNRCLLRGSAKVLEYSDENIKLQFLGSSSDVKAKWGDLYIDSLDYPEVEETYKQWCRKSSLDVPSATYSQGYGGIKGKYVFFTVANEATGKKYNRLRCYGSPMHCVIKRPVLQPNLLYVLHQVFTVMGYRVDYDYFSSSPWTDLYIVNVKRSTRIAGALPHWKISTFLEEFRKLFNAVFIYDENMKTVRIESYRSMGSSGVVAPESESSFKSEHDEEGVSYLGSDNIAYSLVTCADQKYVRDIPKEVFNSFDVKEYATLAEVLTEAGRMTDTEKLTTLFLAGNAGYIYFRKVNEEGAIGYTTCGFFTPLVRDGNTADDSTTELRIIPAPVGDVKVNQSEIEDTCMMPSIEGPEWAALGDEGDTVTLQDVLEDEVSVESDGEDDYMPVAFLASKSDSFIYDNRSDRFYAVMRSFADTRESSLPNDCSLALAHAGSISRYVGQFHTEQTVIDAKNQHVIRFLHEGLPDPTWLFIFRGKRFLCAKVEVTVTDTGIDEMKTGYFYEMLS